MGKRATKRPFFLRISEQSPEISRCAHVSCCRVRVAQLPCLLAGAREEELTRKSESVFEADMRQLSGKERVLRALRGEPVDHPASGPLAVHFCAVQAGVTLKEYTLDARVLADCVVRYHEKYRPDAVWLSADTWVTAQAMGRAVDFPSPDQPMCGVGEALVQKAADIERIPPPDPSTQGRMPLMVEALGLIKRAVGEEAFVVACLDQFPFSLGAALIGINEVMLQVIDDRRFVEAVLLRCVEYTAAYGEALARAGADMLSGGDSPAVLLGPDRYRDIALPAEQRVFERLRRVTDIPLSLHICGDSAAYLPDMATSGADVLEIDYEVSLPAACEAVGPDVALWGNLDPVGVLANGDADEVRQASEAVLSAVDKHRHRRFVLSSGCTLAVETPAANLQAMLDTARRWPGE